MISYELWDIETGNLLGAYATEAEALAMVRRAIEVYSVTYVDGLGLLVDDEQEDESQTLAVGAELADRALAMPAHASVGAARS